MVLVDLNISKMQIFTDDVILTFIKLIVRSLFRPNYAACASKKNYFFGFT
jgi:hypothetical protein